MNVLRMVVMQAHIQSELRGALLQQPLVGQDDQLVALFLLRKLQA